MPTPHGREAPQRLGLIDLGSNSAQMSLLFRHAQDPLRFRVAEELLFVTGLSRNLSPDGHLSTAGKTRARTALRHFARRLETLGVNATDVRAVATAGIRRSTDGIAFLEEVREEIGLKLEVISGAEEAELSALAQERSFPRLCPLIVLDIGGRSTELALRFPGKTLWKTSLDVGSVQLSEQHGSNAAALEKGVDRALAPWRDSWSLERGSWPAEAPVVGVAGTVTTARQVLLGLREWDPTKLHGSELEAYQVEGLIQRLSAMTAEERLQLPGMHPGRADLIVAGLSLLAGLMRVLERDRCLVSDRGVRYGLLWQRWPLVQIRD